MLFMTEQQAVPAALTSAAERLGGSVCDVAFLGEPAEAAAKASWQREIALLQQAGWRVQVDRGPFGRGKVVSSLDAALVQVADLRALTAGPRIADRDSQIVLRHIEPGALAELPSLARRAGRRLVVAPSNGLERRAIQSHLRGHWLSPQDWPLMLGAQPLHAALERWRRQRFRVGVIGAARAHLEPANLHAALASRGVAADTVEILDVPAHRLDQVPLDEFDLLLGPARYGDADIPGLVLRALEAGIPTVLGDAWKPSLRDAALFWDWGQIPERLADCVTDRGRWRQLLLGQLDRANARFGEEAYLERLRRGVHGSAAPPRLPNGQGSKAPVVARVIEVDLVIAGDFRRREEAVEQLLPQIANHAATGRRVGLFQAWNGRRGPRIHPGIDACLRSGKALLIWPGDVVDAKAVQVIVPRLTVPALDAMRPAITAQAWHMVEAAGDIDDYDPQALHTTVERLYDVRPLWHAVQRAVQDKLATRVPTAPDRWPLAVMPIRARSVRRRARSVVGCLAYTPDEASSVIVPLNEICTAANAECRLLMCGTRRSLDRVAPGNVQVLSIEGADVARFVAQLDILVVSPRATATQLPLRAIAEALALGMPVLGVPEHEIWLPEGTTILPVAAWPAHVGGAARRPRAKAECPSTEPSDDVGQRLGLVPPKSARSVVRNRTKRVLFVTANGVGLGHITRLSAIARRLPARLEPVFATMSQAASVLEDLGFATELLTTYNGKSGKPWDYWTRERMLEILDYHQPAALVLDASNPYSGVVEAAAARPDLKLVWVRRGMWRASQDNSPFLARAPYFDLIIEPDDIAAALDVVRQQASSGNILEVPPIGLLDEDELLERDEARRALGLPEAPAGGSVLVQLGSGTTRDLNRLLARVMDTLYCFQGLEIVLAQWLNTADEYRGRWRDVRLLTGFPIPRYYRAFDFTISAAGYNSFNDLLRFGVPTIFIANDAECMDDQGARARYAQAQNAAFDIEESNLEALYDCVQAILQAPVRGYLSEQARLLARPNGAAPAARAIARLLN